MPSINEQIFDRTVRHATFLARLSSAEANKIVKFLDTEVYPDLIERIRSRLERHRSGSVRGLHSTKRMLELKRDIDQIIREGTREAYRQTSAILRDAAVVEARSVVRMLDDVFEPFRISSTMPSTPLLRSIVSNSMIRGEFLRDDFSAMSARNRRNVARAINIGLAQGESIESIVRRVRGSSVNPGGVLAASRHDARRIVRTAVNHTTTRAREITYRDNSDVISGVRWVSTLDARTSQVCISLDGQVFGIDEGPRPPAHPFCRSTTSPVTKSFRELGIDLDEIPPGTRASADGQVPDSVTYPKWLRRQSTETQNQVLGPTLAKHWRAGRVTVDRFIDSQYRPLSLSEILRLEGISP